MSEDVTAAAGVAGAGWVRVDYIYSAAMRSEDEFEWNGHHVWGYLLAVRFPQCFVSAGGACPAAADAVRERGLRISSDGVGLPRVEGDVSLSGVVVSSWDLAVRASTDPALFVGTPISVSKAEWCRLYTAHPAEADPSWECLAYGVTPCPHDSHILFGGAL